MTTSLSTVAQELDDFSGHTSSESTQLIQLFPELNDFPNPRNTKRPANNQRRVRNRKNKRGYWIHYRLVGYDEGEDSPFVNDPI